MQLIFRDERVFRRLGMEEQTLHGMFKVRKVLLVSTVETQRATTSRKPPPLISHNLCKMPNSRTSRKQPRHRLGLTCS